MPFSFEPQRHLSAEVSSRLSVEVSLFQILLLAPMNVYISSRPSHEPLDSAYPARQDGHTHFRSAHLALCRLQSCLRHVSNSRLLQPFMPFFLTFADFVVEDNAGEAMIESDGPFVLR
jgi:hypothetical protein